MTGHHELAAILLSSHCPRALQRDIAAPTWGWSEPGDKISVTLDHRHIGSPSHWITVTLDREEYRESSKIAGPDGEWMTNG
jgi:hypothetical protein